MDKYGSLNNESIKRAELAYKIFKKKGANKLITSGWDYRSDSSIFIAEAFMEFFVENKNMLKENIYCENKSRDTVGDAVLSRLNAYKKFKFKKLIIVTSDYHLKRTKEIFKFTYGSLIELEYFGAKTEGKESHSESEKESLIAFRNTFKNIESGNLKSIFHNLISKHPYYNGEIFEKLIL